MKKWKAIAGVVLVFVLGGIAGGLVVLKVCGTWERPPVSTVMHKLDRRLSLDADQHRQIEAIIREARSEMNAVRKEAQPRIEAIMKSTHEKISAVLRSGQKEKFERLSQKWREMRMKREKEEEEREAK